MGRELTYSVLAGLEPWTALARGGRSGRGFALCQRLDPSQAPPASGYSKCSPRYLARTGGYDWPSGRLRVLYCSCCLESDAALGLCGWSGLRALHEADFHARACWGRWPRTATHVTQSHAESASTKHHRREPSSARRRPLRPPLPPPSSLFPLPSPHPHSPQSPSPITSPIQTKLHVTSPCRPAFISGHDDDCVVRTSPPRADLGAICRAASTRSSTSFCFIYHVLALVGRLGSCWSLAARPPTSSNLREREREKKPRDLLPPPASTAFYEPGHHETSVHHPSH